MDSRFHFRVVPPRRAMSTARASADANKATAFSTSTLVQAAGVALRGGLTRTGSLSPFNDFNFLGLVLREVFFVGAFTTFCREQPREREVQRSNQENRGFSGFRPICVLVLDPYMHPRATSRGMGLGSLVVGRQAYSNSVLPCCLLCTGPVVVVLTDL